MFGCVGPRVHRESRETGETSKTQIGKTQIGPSPLEPVPLLLVCVLVGPGHGQPCCQRAGSLCALSDRPRPLLAGSASARAGVRGRVCACRSRVYERVSRRIWGAPPVTAKGQAPAMFLIGAGRARSQPPLVILSVRMTIPRVRSRRTLRAATGPMEPLRTSEPSRPGAAPAGGAHVGQLGVFPTVFLLNLQLPGRMAGRRKTPGRRQCRQASVPRRSNRPADHSGTMPASFAVSPQTVMSSLTRWANAAGGSPPGVLARARMRATTSGAASASATSA